MYFEDVRKKIGCTYISDLHFCQENIEKDGFDFVFSRIEE